MHTVYYLINTCQPYNLFLKVFYTKIFNEGATSLENTTIKHYENSINVEKYNSTILFEKNIKVENFKYYIAERDNLSRKEEGFGFANRVQEEFSLLNKFYNMGLIEKKEFTLEIKDRIIKYLHLGGISKDKRDKCKYSAVLKTLKYEDLWSVRLNAIKFNGKSYYVNYKMSFKTCIDPVIDSNAFFNFMVTNVFEKALEKKKCNYYIEKTMKNVTGLKCEAASIMYNPPLYFEFEEKVMELSLDRIFYCGSFICKSWFFYNPNYGNETIGAFGNYFFNLMNYIVFNHEDNTVGLYGDLIIFHDKH